MKNKTHKKQNYLQPETEIKPIKMTIPPRETPADSIDERFRRGGSIVEEISPERVGVVEESRENERRRSCKRERKKCECVTRVT